MTAFALISDLHSNLPALEAVFRRIDELGVPEVCCLGDVVGYGADAINPYLALEALSYTKNSLLADTDIDEQEAFENYKKAIGFSESNGSLETGYFLWANTYLARMDSGRKNIQS